MNSKRSESDFRFSLTSEILISLILLMIITISIIGVISLGIIEATTKEGMPSRSDIIAETIQKTIIRLAKSETFSISSIIPEIGFYLNVKDVALVDTNLKNIYGVHDTISTEELAYANEAKNSRRMIKKKRNGNVYYYIPVFKKENLEGVVRIRMTVESGEFRINIYKKLLIMYILLGSIFIVLMGIFILRRRIVKPLQNLNYYTKKIAQGNFSERITPTGGKELVELSESFNIMAENLEAKQKELAEKIEELERTNKELISAQNEVLQTEKLASIGQMASGIVHELGNPISAISGNIDLLIKRIKGEKEQEIIQRIRNDIDRMDKIIRDLLDFARPGRAQLQSVDIRQSIGSTIELIKTQKGFENIEIMLQAGPDTPMVLADTTLLRQVWLNLFLNSKDAMPSGGKIVIKIRKDPNTVKVEFSDSGHGIKKEDLGKIFEPFFTTKEPGKGTGLGLTVVQRIIHSMNGKITVESEEGKGTTFTITLPAHQL